MLIRFIIFITYVLIENIGAKHFLIETDDNGSPNSPPNQDYLESFVQPDYSKSFAQPICQHKGLKVISCTTECHQDGTCNTYNAVNICSCEGKELYVNGTAKYDFTDNDPVETDQVWEKNQDYMICEPCNLFCFEFGRKITKGPLHLKEMLNC